MGVNLKTLTTQQRQPRLVGSATQMPVDELCAMVICNQVAFVAQQPLLAPTLTLEGQLRYPLPPENVLEAAASRSMHRASRGLHGRMQWALQRVGLGGLVDRSGGLDRHAPWIGAKMHTCPCVTRELLGECVGAPHAQNNTSQSMAIHIFLHRARLFPPPISFPATHIFSHHSAPLPWRGTAPCPRPRACPAACAGSAG